MSMLTLALLNDTNRAGDGITRDARLTGTAEPNGSVTLLDGDTVLAEIATDADGRFTYAPGLRDGLHTITARQGAGAAQESTQLAFHLDTVAPTLPLLRLNDGANADLPTDILTGLPLINARVLQGDLFLNVVSAGVETEGAAPVSGRIGFSTDAFVIDPTIFAVSPLVGAFPGNPVGDGIMTVVVRAGTPVNALLQHYVPDGTYTIRVDVSDLAGNAAVPATQAIVVDMRADGGAAASLLLAGPEAHGITKAGAHAVTFTVSGLDADAAAIAHFTDGTHTRSVAVAADGTGTVDLTGFAGTVSGSLSIADVHGNTATVAGNAVRMLGATPGDFDGAGAADLLWLNGAGTFTVWQADANGFTPNTHVGTTPGVGWTLEAQADFNGDGRADLAWRSQTGALTIWHADGAGFTPDAVLHEGKGPSWHVAAVADFSGDGRADILWRDAGGAFTVDHATGSGFSPDRYADASVAPAWRLIGSADFSGDGRADLLWRNDENGVTTVWDSTGPGFRPNTVVDGTIGLDWHVNGTGDFDGDGRADLLLRDDTGTFAIRHAGHTGFAAPTQVEASVTTDWQIAKVADFNGDGLDDLLWRHAAGTFTEWQSTGEGFTRNTTVDATVSTEWQIAANGFDFV